MDVIAKHHKTEISWNLIKSTRKSNVERFSIVQCFDFLLQLRQPSATLSEEKIDKIQIRSKVGGGYFPSNESQLLNNASSENQLKALK